MQTTLALLRQRTQLELGDDGINRRIFFPIEGVQLLRNPLLAVVVDIFIDRGSEQGAARHFLLTGKLVRLRKNIVWNRYGQP